MLLVTKLLLSTTTHFFTNESVFFRCLAPHACDVTHSATIGGAVGTSGETAGGRSGGRVRLHHTRLTTCGTTYMVEKRQEAILAQRKHVQVQDSGPIKRNLTRFFRVTVTGTRPSAAWLLSRPAKTMERRSLVGPRTSPCRTARLRIHASLTCIVIENCCSRTLILRNIACVHRCVYPYYPVELPAAFRCHVSNRVFVSYAKHFDRSPSIRCRRRFLIIFAPLSGHCLARDSVSRSEHSSAGTISSPINEAFRRRRLCRA